MDTEYSGKTEYKDGNMSIKDKIIVFLLGLAAALGTVVFFLWKLYAHGRELEKSNHFLENATSYNKEEVLKGLRIEQDTTEKQAEVIREEVEKAKKEDIVYAFEKAFGVGDHHTYKYRDPAEDRGDV